MSDFLQTQGTVTDIKVIPKHSDQYGPYNQFFVDLDNGLSLSLKGSKPSPNGKGPDGKWQTFGVGGQISAFYTQNGEYNNTKSGQVTVLNQGNSGAVQQSAPQPSGTATVGGPPAAPAAGTPSLGGKTLEIKAGRAVNVASNLFVAGHVKTVEDGLREAVRLEVLADKYYGRLYEEEKQKIEAPASAPQPQPQPVPQPAPQPEPQPNAVSNLPDGGEPAFDDDIPF